ncbi:hypothetical protein BFJ71_g15816 [Fusarium oxysporum]|nr:hypothetical protein BFJ71_g15816 [Fusarium oxysporum]
MLPSPPSAFALLRPTEKSGKSIRADDAVWRNKRYVLEESLSRKGSKGRKSWIKRHGFFLVEIDTNDSPLSPYWACRLCDAKGQPEFFAAAATSSAADHLRKIFESSQGADMDPSTDESERPKRRRLQYSAVPRARVKMIRELSLGLLINTNVPFSFFSDTFFQQLACQLDPHLPDQIPRSRQSMGRLLDVIIHLGFDLWTSPNRHAVMAVTAHFLDRQGKHQSRLLALRRQLGCHSGENLAVTLGQVVREWKIEDRVRTVISDNASSNDSCLLNFYGDLDAEMGPADVRARRMRCYGHILNLVARAFLYGEDFEAFEAESQVFDLLGRREDDVRHWRKKGPVGKLHNVVKFIRSSPQWRELFKRISRENDEAQEYVLASESTAELEVVMNNDTRWNSTYLMISRALVKQGDIRAFLVHPEVEKWLPEADMLKGDDWRLLAEIKHILEPFYLQTMRTQGWGSEGGNGRLWEPSRGSGQCDDGSGKPSGSSAVDDMGKDHRRYLRLSIITAWQKLNEYYTKLGESPLFAASIILNPSLGMSYLEVNWASEEQLVWVRDAKIGLSDYLDRWYRCNRPVDEQRGAIIETTASPSVLQRTPVDSIFKQWVKSRTAKTTVTGSELERYLQLEPQETEDPIEWWMAHQGQFPTPRQIDGDVAGAFDDDGNIGEVAMSEELGQTWCGEAGGDSKWGRRGLVEDWGIVAGEHRGPTLKVVKYLKYDPGFDLFDLRAALPTAVAPAAADLAEGSLLTRGTIDTYISAVIELWRLQVAHGNANTENPRGAAVRGFLEQRGRQRGKHDRASFKDRGTDGFQAGYSPDEWLRVHDLLLSWAAYMPQNLRTRVDLLFGHYYLLRGENRRKMELANLAKVFTVRDVWKEWEEGIAGQPAVRVLEETWGSRWRPGNRIRVQFCRRKVIWDELLARTASGKNEEEAVAELELLRAGRSLNRLIDELKQRRWRGQG